MVHVTIKNRSGIHARPASIFVDLASKFAGTVTLIKNEKRYNGKSIMSIMSMALRENDTLEILVEGEGSEGLEEQLKAILEAVHD